MDRIRLREPRFHEHAYLFVLAALEYCQTKLTERRHITGRELSDACRALALDRSLEDALSDLYALLGLVTDALVRLLERRALRWR